MGAAAWLLVAACATASAMSRSPYQEGVAAFESRDWAAAESRLAQVDARAEPHASYLLGVLAEKRKDWLPAVDRFDRYLAFAPSRGDLRPAALAHKAYCLAAGGQVDAAATLLAASEALTPDKTTAFVLAYADLAVARARGPAPRARAAARRAEARFGWILTRLPPEDPEARYGRGLARLALTRTADAAADFRRAAALDPRPAFLLAEGQAWLDLKKLDAARAAYRRAADLADRGGAEHSRAMRALGKIKELEAARSPHP